MGSLSEVKLNANQVQGAFGERVLLPETCFVKNNIAQKRRGSNDLPGTRFTWDPPQTCAKTHVLHVVHALHVPYVLWHAKTYARLHKSEGLA